VTDLALAAAAAVHNATDLALTAAAALGGLDSQAGLALGGALGAALVLGLALAELAAGVRRRLAMRALERDLAQHRDETAARLRFLLASGAPLLPRPADAAA
jgi:hypothetical protein